MTRYFAITTLRKCLDGKKNNQQKEEMICLITYNIVSAKIIE